MSFFKLFTPISYWLLVICWLFIFCFYIHRIITKKIKNKLLLTLLIILSIDAFRTLFESLYFGAWYTSVVGLLPPSVHDFLVRPQNVFIPKILNLIAAILIIFIVLRRWIPEEEAERTREISHLENLNTEIVERKHLFEELKERTSTLNDILENAADGICVCNNIPEWPYIHFTTWNPRMTEITGYTLEEINRLGWYQSLYPDPIIQKKAIARMTSMRMGDNIIAEVWDITTKDGSLSNISISTTVLKEENGEFHVLGIMQDISERKRTTDLLMERQRLYHTLFENNSSVMLLIDPETSQISDANKSACLYYGYSRATLTSLKITEINTLSEEEVYAEMDKAKLDKRNYFNFRHKLSDGTIRDVEVFSGSITVSGKPLLCSIIHDISDRIMAARERERLINELQQSLSEVKTLRGFLPICASCKNIRDDKGYWNKIESYITKHSDVDFSHSICPECSNKLYGDEDWYQQKDKDSTKKTKE